MNEQQIKLLIDSIVKLSETVEKKNTELVAYSKQKRVFLDLMSVNTEPYDTLSIYEFDKDKESFELVA